MLRMFDRNRGMGREFFQSHLVSISEVAFEAVDQFECANRFARRIFHRHTQQRSGLKAKLLVNASVDLFLFAGNILVNARRFAS